VPHMVNTVTTLVDKGATVQAALDDPSLTAEQRATVQAVVADPTIVPKVQSLAAKYKTQLATAAKIDPATQAALAKNPTDVNAQITALHDLTGISVKDVTTVVRLNVQHGQALQAGAAIDPATAAVLLSNPTDKQAATKAVQEIVAKLHVTAQQAIALITELRSIPIPDLLTVQANGPKVLAAAAQLKALGAVPAADLAFLKKYGPSLQDPKVQSDLKYLAANGPQVQKAAADSPKQWQHYFWIAVGGEIVFIPFIFLMAGYWSARKARRAEEEHEAMVEAELAKLNA
jgi:ACS family D-galactonate transporter-like MFS transporter